MRIIFFLLLIPLFSNGQKIATTFQKAESQGISIAQLDERYQGALHSDSTKAAFKGKEKEFYESYKSLLQDLNKHLVKNDFHWKKTTKCFNRIYMDNSGSIDYFLFNFYPGEIEVDEEKQFEKLLGEFIQTYQFPLTNENKFAQCSPVTYTVK